MVMVRCENCLYILRSHQERCPECNHLVQRSIEAFERRGVALDEKGLHYTHIGAILTVSIVLTMIVVSALWIANIWLQDRMIHYTSWYALAIAGPALGGSISLMLGISRLTSVAVLICFSLASVLLFVQSPGGFPSTWFGSAIVVIGALFPILVGVVLLLLRSLFQQLRERPGSFRSAFASIMAGVICTIAVSFHLPTAEAAKGIVLITVWVALATVGLEARRVLRKTRIAIPAIS